MAPSRRDFLQVMASASAAGMALGRHAEALAWYEKAARLEDADLLPIDYRIGLAQQAGGEVELCEDSVAAFAKAEEEHIFAQEWLCAGRADALAKPGDYLTMNIAGEPVIILRDREGALRGMSNVCRHRMSTLLEGRGNVRSIVCPYHAWTYNLDGSLRGAPAMARNEDFCREDVKDRKSTRLNSSH